MRTLKAAGSSSSTVVLVVILIVVASIIAAVIAMFILVRFLEKRRKLRAEAIVQAGSTLNEGVRRRRRRFSETEYGNLPRVESKRVRRFSAGEDHWAVTLRGVDEQITAVTEQVIEDRVDEVVDKQIQEIVERVEDRVTLTVDDSVEDIIVSPTSVQELVDKHIDERVTDVLVDLPKGAQDSQTELQIEDTTDEVVQTDPDFRVEVNEDFRRVPKADQQTQTEELDDDILTTSPLPLLYSSPPLGVYDSWHDCNVQFQLVDRSRDERDDEMTNDKGIDYVTYEIVDEDIMTTSPLPLLDSSPASRSDSDQPSRQWQDQLRTSHSIRPFSHPIPINDDCVSEQNSLQSPRI